MLKLRHFLTGVLAAVMSIGLTAPAEAAYTTRPDLSTPSSLEIHYHQGDLAFDGVDFKVYKVADMNERAQFEFTERFSEYPTEIHSDMSQSDWSDMAELLAGYVSRDGLTPDWSGSTDASGKYKLSDLDAGLLLVVGGNHTREYKTEEGTTKVYYHAAPFLVSTPSMSDDGWTHDLAASPKFTASEDKFLSRRVLKVWDDKGYESNRPKSVTVDLLKDGEVKATVTLNDENSWRYQWDELDNSSQWRIVERGVSGYQVSERQEGITCVVTNKYKVPSSSGSGGGSSTTVTPVTPEPPEPPVTPVDPEPPVEPVTPVEPEEPVVTPEPVEPTPAPVTEPKLPQTGQLWWPVPVLAASGMIIFLAGWGVSRRTGKKEEK